MSHPPPPNAIAKQEKNEKKAPQLCQEMILASRDRFAAALGKQMPVEKLAATVALIVARNPKLVDCGIASIVLSAFTGATLGLSSDPVRGEFYIVPFKDKDTGRLIATPVIGYKGKIKLGFRGGLQQVFACEVCEHDEFKRTWGLNPSIFHDVTKYPRGRIIGAYAVAWMKDNPRPSFAHMTVEEIEEIRQRAPSGNSPAWRNHYAEQCKKTAIHRMFKMIQLDLPDQVLSAMALDDSPDAASEMRQVFGAEVPEVVAELDAPLPSNMGLPADDREVVADPPAEVTPKAPKAKTPPAPAMLKGTEIIGPLVEGLPLDVVLGYLRSITACPMSATSLDQVFQKRIAEIQADPAAFKAALDAYLAK